MEYFEASQVGRPHADLILLLIGTLSSYLGELGIWTGIFALASTSLQSPYFPKGTLGVAALSPLFTWFLLTKASVASRQGYCSPYAHGKSAGVRRPPT